jgi:hypothetical protein
MYIMSNRIFLKWPGCFPPGFFFPFFNRDSTIGVDVIYCSGPREPRSRDSHLKLPYSVSADRFFQLDSFFDDSEIILIFFALEAP